MMPFAKDIIGACETGGGGGGANDEGGTGAGGCWGGGGASANNWWGLSVRESGFCAAKRRSET